MCRTVAEIVDSLWFLSKRRTYYEIVITSEARDLLFGPRCDDIVAREKSRSLASLVMTIFPTGNVG